VAAFDAATLASGLSGHTETLIYGDAGIGVTGIVDNVISIYSDIPATAGSLDVYNLDTEGWAAYEAASSGLWFTTIDPATTGYDAETDFTTVFIGEADTWGFTTWGILLGIACQIDLANMEKADNALVFAQNYAGFSTAVTLWPTPQPTSLDTCWASTITRPAVTGCSWPTIRTTTRAHRTTPTRATA
jgi:hypothetical protein